MKKKEKVGRRRFKEDEPEEESVESAVGDKRLAWCWRVSD